jgi:hypothetical protein
MQNVVTDPALNYGAATIAAVQHASFFAEKAC